MRISGVFVIMGLLLSSCEGQSPSNTKNLVEAAPVIKTAADVADRLKAAGLPITDIKILTAETDDNQLLGRPGQYTSKLFFYDNRHSKVADTDQNQNTIEVFETSEAAKIRHDYVESVTQGMAFLAQYQLLQGKILVRLDKALLPAEVEGYKAALGKIE